MVVLPPATADGINGGVVEHLSDDAPRQYVHPEKRAALERAGYRMLEVRYNEGTFFASSVLVLARRRR